ncbi:hypothetical protein [Sessilibacter sp. MAH2]
MKAVVQTIVLAVALGSTSSAFAFGSQQATFFDYFWKPKPGCFLWFFCKKPKDKPEDPAPVPELNAAAAPLSAAIVLSAIALGAERRRRKLRVENTPAV